MAKEQIVCPCGKKFKAKPSAHRRFCSNKCSVKYKKSINVYRDILTKKFFEKEYFQLNQTLNDIVRKYNIHIDTIRHYFHNVCKLKLRSLSTNQKLRSVSQEVLENIRRAGKKRRRGKYCICKNCGNEYYLGRKRTIKIDRGYCSFKCQFVNIELEDLKYKKFPPGHLKFIYDKLLTKRFFQEQYFNQKKAFEVISKEFSIHISSLYKYFKKHNLKSRTTSENMIGRKFTYQHIQKLMRAISKRIYYKDIEFKSSWEANFAKWCDLSDVKWEYEPKMFEVTVKEKTFRYIPDFYLPELDMWVEVKEDG